MGVSLARVTRISPRTRSFVASVQRIGFFGHDGPCQFHQLMRVPVLSELHVEISMTVHVQGCMRASCQLERPIRCSSIALMFGLFACQYMPLLDAVIRRCIVAFRTLVTIMGAVLFPLR